MVEDVSSRFLRILMDEMELSVRRSKHDLGYTALPKVTSARNSMKATDLMKSAIIPETPIPSRESEEFWGSDPIAAMLRELAIPYVSLVPGATYRGLHDSIVNYLGNRMPQIVLSIHEENAIAVAHGYAKVT